ncbi:hypothetical protein [Mucilaginibacter robiniae]|nr:hypothetical protein [Mucilaginibacter robiniae]
MSKDKGSKNLKKAPNTDNQKSVSDYQAGKKTVSKDALTPPPKKK